jgi:hypothetical protein
MEFLKNVYDTFNSKEVKLTQQVEWKVSNVTRRWGKYVKSCVPIVWEKKLQWFQYG